MSDTRWRGCHGVQLHPARAARSFGAFSGDPILGAEVAVGSPGVPDGEQLWRADGEVSVDGDVRAVEQLMWRAPDGSFVLETQEGAVLAIDSRARRIVVRAGDNPTDLQLIASFALPVLLHEHGDLVLHASACAIDGGAVVIVGPSGAGKSSLMIALINAGWEAISEDLCAIAAHDDLVAYPGPPWVRLAHGIAGPRDSTELFRTFEKTAWDLAPRMVDEATPVARVVLLQPPGGDGPTLTAVDPDAALGHIARQAVWIGVLEDRAPSLFPLCARLARAVPTVQLRLPVSPGWTDLAVGMLSEL